MGGLTESVLGSNKNQSTQQQQQGSQFTQFLPQDIAAIRGQEGNLMGQTQQFGAGSQALAGQGLNALQGMTTNFGNQPLDATANQLIAGEMGRNKAALQTGQNQLAQQFQHNPILAKILGSQLQGQTQLANNPLAFQASQEQIGRQQAGNQAILSQLGGLGAVQGIASNGLQAQNSLLDQLSRIGQQFGTAQNQSSSNSNTDITSGGLVGKLSGGMLGLGEKGGQFGGPASSLNSGGGPIGQSITPGFGSGQSAIGRSANAPQSGMQK